MEKIQFWDGDLALVLQVDAFVIGVDAGPASGNFTTAFRLPPSASLASENNVRGMDRRREENRELTPRKFSGRDRWPSDIDGHAGLGSGALRRTWSLLWVW